MRHITKKEILRRINRFQSRLVERNLDGAFIMQNVDIFYFSGTIQTAFLFIPSEGQPILMVQKSYERAKNESPLNNILPINGKSHLKDTLKDFGFSMPEQIGLEMDVLPTQIFLWFQETFPNSLWTDISQDIRRLRMLKSDFEILQIRNAARILHKGFLEIAGIIREGMTELEVDGQLAFIARREGHMGILRMRGWNQEMTYAHVLSGDSGAKPSFLNSPHGGNGNTAAMAQGAGFRKIQKNEPIGIDFGVGINGYLGDQTRTFVLGRMPEHLEKAHQCSKQIHMLMCKHAGPGVSCSDLYDMALTEAAKQGYADFFMGYGENQVKFIGHGIGLEIDEYPILSPQFHEDLAEGMVLAIEPKFVFPGEGMVGLEDDYVVTSSGLERVTLTDQKIMRIA